MASGPTPALDLSVPQVAYLQLRDYTHLNLILAFLTFTEKIDKQVHFIL